MCCDIEQEIKDLFGEEFSQQQTGKYYRMVHDITYAFYMARLFLGHKNMEDRFDLFSKKAKSINTENKDQIFLELQKEVLEYGKIDSIITRDYCQIFDYNDFEIMAEKILNNSHLLVNGKTFRICEIEFYYHGKDHEDEYVHKNPDQAKYGVFYFHKYKTGTYKSGTYKGMDMTYGDEDTFFGVLIRSIYDIENDEMIEGPCRSVNKVLELYGLDKVSDFVRDDGPLHTHYNQRKFYLIKGDLPQEIIYKGPRVGLSDKYPEYKSKNYRFLIMKNKIKKQKKDLVAI